jgi:peptide/nickel transport system permease protein
MMLDATLSQDMYLAGGFVLILCTLTIIGTLVSDILLAWADPRIRFE